LLRLPRRSSPRVICGYSGNMLYAYPILVASQDFIVFDPSKNARLVRALELHSNGSCSSAVAVFVEEFSSNAAMLADYYFLRSKLQIPMNY